MAPRVAIIFYSTWGHIKTLAEAELKGIQSAGGSADLWQVPETLPKEVLDKMYAPGQETFGVPVLNDVNELTKYDALLLGIPTRYGNFPAQWKAFWDRTGGLWAKGALYGKYVGVFVSTGSQGGGQESTVLATLSTFSHHGIFFVPLGAKSTAPLLSDLSEVRGGSAWGAGTFSGGDGSRKPTEKELQLATEQGKLFWEAVSKVNFA